AGGENAGSNGYAPVRGDVQIGDPLQDDACSELAADHIRILLKQFDHACADVAEPYETNLDIAHCSSLVSSVLGHASISSRMPFTNAGDSLSPNLRAISIASLMLTFLGMSLRNISSKVARRMTFRSTSGILARAQFLERALMAASMTSRFS